MGSIRWADGEWREVIRIVQQEARRFRNQVADPDSIFERAMENIVRAQAAGAVVTNPSAWARTITRRAGIDAVRAEPAGDPEGMQEDSPLLRLTRPTDDVPATLFRQHESHDMLHSLASLGNDGYRQAVVLRDLRGLDDTEVASELGVSYETARQWISRGRRAIRSARGA